MDATRANLHPLKFANSCIAPVLIDNGSLKRKMAKHLKIFPLRMLKFCFGGKGCIISPNENVLQLWNLYGRP